MCDIVGRGFWKSVKITDIIHGWPLKLIINEMFKLPKMSYVIDREVVVVEVRSSKLRK